MECPFLYAQRAYSYENGALGTYSVSVRVITLVLMRRDRLSEEYFISHVKRQHQGIIPHDSQLNRPFWYDWVKFKSEELEELYCYTLSDLSEVIL